MRWWWAEEAIAEAALFWLCVQVSHFESVMLGGGGGGLPEDPVCVCSLLQ